ncbi:MAG: hypothetical protein CM15mP31_4890 [Gammaproteobacteria bacterium]|nr:MAG: hypothetical protein CM15mP31_4890 [Gammaproteobacteria bacterium]
MAAKRNKWFYKITNKGWTSKSAPRSSFGQRGVNIWNFVKFFNDKTKSLAGKPVPCEITVYKDKNLT